MKEKYIFVSISGVKSEEVKELEAYLEQNCWKWKEASVIE